MFDRLVGGAVFAQPNGVVRPHKDGWHTHKRGQPDCRAHVIGEDEERSGVTPRKSTQVEAINIGSGSVSANTEVRGTAVGVTGQFWGLPTHRQKGRSAGNGR